MVLDRLPERSSHSGKRRAPPLIWRSVRASSSSGGDVFAVVREWRSALSECGTSSARSRGIGVHRVGLRRLAPARSRQTFRNRAPAEFALALPQSWLAGRRLAVSGALQLALRAPCTIDSRRPGLVGRRRKPGPLRISSRLLEQVLPIRSAGMGRVEELR